MIVYGPFNSYSEAQLSLLYAVLHWHMIETKLRAHETYNRRLSNTNCSNMVPHVMPQTYFSLKSRHWLSYDSYFNTGAATQGCLMLWCCICKWGVVTSSNRISSCWAQPLAKQIGPWCLHTGKLAHSSTRSLGVSWEMRWAAQQIHKHGVMQPYKSTAAIATGGSSNTQPEVGPHNCWQQGESRSWQGPSWLFWHLMWNSSTWSALL